MARQVPSRFLVALSLAGRQRQLVRAIAEEVERQLGESTVFYDEWFEFYIAGANADLRLQRIYRQQCDLAIIFISGDYGTESWPQAEYEAIRARYMEAVGSELDSLRVMALRVGDGEVAGIHLNHIVPDLRGRSIKDAARLILDRLRLVSPAALESNANAPVWPKELPVFRWPIADHNEAQAAFCSILTRTSRAKLLTIEGAPATGKSSLAKQMERNVAELVPGLRCGRLDFKGTADRRTEVDAFAESLGLPEADGHANRNPLRSALGQLLHSSKPTLLIFDTYEEAGEVRNWIERLFLPKLRQAQWLRIVVLGQRVPPIRGEVWESIAAIPTKLELPGPNAWLEYSRSLFHDDDITLDFVAKAHRLSRGHPATLASLLEPR